MELSDTYRRLLRLPEGSIAYLSPDAAIDLAGVGNGIIFVAAKWSGASQVAFRALNQALARFAELHDTKVYLANADDPKTQQFITRRGDVPSGGGETYWIKDGQLIARASNYNEDQIAILEGNTERLFGGR